MSEQLVLDIPEVIGHEKLYADVFSKLYYHLYSNSSISRAERLMTDLSSLLLCRIVGEREARMRGDDALSRFVQGGEASEETLVPLLRRAFPHLADAEGFSLGDGALRSGMRLLEGLSLSEAPAHALGEAFHALIGPRLRGDKGQFFTPRSLARAMVQIAAPHDGAKVVDPACGTGGFLSEAWAYWSARGHSGQLVGVDKDRDLCRLSEALLEIVAPGSNAVWNANSLDVSGLRCLGEELSPLEADYVLTNPPFGAKIKVTEPTVLRDFALGHRWREAGGIWKQEGTLREAQDPQILFVELALKLLKPGGVLGIVLPEGVFGNSGTGYVWDWLRAQGEILALLDCPRTTFQPGTDIKTNVLFFRKKWHAGPAPWWPSPKGEEQAWMAVARHCGHDRRGRSRRVDGTPMPDDFPLIGEAFATRKEPQAPRAGGAPAAWQRARISQPYYLCPRYYDTATRDALEAQAARWNTSLASLGDLMAAGHLSIRKGHEVGAEAYGTGEVPFVRTSDIANYEISTDPSRGLSEEIYEQYRSVQGLAPRDILMVCDGRYRIGRTAILTPDTARCVVQSHVRILSLGPGAPLDAYDLLHALNLPAVQALLRNLVFVQSTLGSLGGRLREVLVPLPPSGEAAAQWSTSVSKLRHTILERAALLRRLREFEAEDEETSL